ncbi:MAG TPA: restriction endonuclease [Solirubrobacteraceae bacterium]|jgi:hypothetical protein
MIDELHAELFGWQPEKIGIEYERLATMLIAVLGLHDWAHEAIECTVDRRTKHQLDIATRNPAGEVRHLLIECRDLDKTVDKPTIDGLVDLRTQTGADVIAAVTTKGFTDDARSLAAEEGVNLVCLHPFSKEDVDGFTKRIEMTFVFYAPAYSDFDIGFMSNNRPIRGVQFQIALDEDHHLLNLDGSPAETVSEILGTSDPPMKEGAFRQRATFQEGRLLQVVGGDPIAISALEWTETVRRDAHTTVIETDGDPVLVVERLGDDSCVLSKRMVVDDDLYAWELDGEGGVIHRGPLGLGCTSIV